jgi:predicted short-subunit dehydrogenase-like oxidoreductase (DUF2520 family)
VTAGVRWRTARAAVHCSAATEVATLEPAARQGPQIGGFHPLQSFGDPDLAVKTLPGCAIAIEADDPLRARLEKLCCTVSACSRRNSAGASKPGILISARWAPL